MWPIFKTEMFICQSKANLDVKILFDIFHLIDPEYGKILERGPRFPFWSMVYLL